MAVTAHSAFLRLLATAPFVVGFAAAHSAAADRRVLEQQRSHLMAWSGELEGRANDKLSPVKRVTKLLQEMQGQLQKDAEADAANYKKMECFCETNEKAKTKAIEEADVKISDLLAQVEAMGGKDGGLGAQIQHLKEEIATKKAALDKAVAIREKERASFMGEEKETVQAVTMLKNALTILSRHNSGLLQLTPGVREGLDAALSWASLRHEEMTEMSSERAADPRAPVLLSVVREGRRRAAFADTFLAARRAATALPMEYAAQVLASAAAAAGQGDASASFAQQRQGGKQPAHLQSYSSQSGEIYGVLKQLKDEFEDNLSASQKAELKAQESFQELKVAAEEELDASKARLDELEADFAGNEKALADAKEDLEATRKQRADDTQFLSDLRLRCQDIDHQWEKRSEARTAEIKAVSGAIAILTEDDARDLFQKKFGSNDDQPPSLLQVGDRGAMRAEAGAAVAARHAASAFLLAAAQREEGPSAAGARSWRRSDTRPQEQLAAMAVQVQLDTFSKVTEAIDNLVVELKAQQEEEVKQKAQCNGELRDNEKETYATNETLADITDKVSEIDESIDKLTADIKAAELSIAELKLQIKKAGEARQQESAEFQEEANDQRAVQQILSKAVARMRTAYSDKQPALLQEDPQPGHFQPYKQNAGAISAISLIEAIIEDSAKVEHEAIAAEQESQKAYASFVEDSNESMKLLQKAIESKTATKADAMVRKESAEAEQSNIENQLEILANVAGDLHLQCDFLLRNFDIRQNARLKEVEALQGAKAFLSGMSA